MKMTKLIWSMALAVALTVATGAGAQTAPLTIDPKAPQVSYVKAGPKASLDAKSADPLAGMVKMRSRKSSRDGSLITRLMEQQRTSLNNLLQSRAPIHITPAKLQQARAKAKGRAPFVPNNNHKHLIVNVIYNSNDETQEDGIFAIDIETGELTCLVSGLSEYDCYGFNGGGYIWNGRYRGVFFDQGTVVSRSNNATVLEYNMDDWSLESVGDLPYMTSMALGAATYIDPSGATTVVGQFWGVDGEGNLSLRYATLDGNGRTTTKFGQSAQKHMLCMGVTSDQQLYGVAKDGNLYHIDSNTAEEQLIGHTGIDDLVDYEGHFWLQAGEIDQRDDTFYWMAEHASKFWTELCAVDLATGRATVLIDFLGDLECAGMIIAPQQRKDDTPASATGLTAAFTPLLTTGSGSFTAPDKRYDGQPLSPDATLYYHLYVNDVKQAVAGNTTTPGATTTFAIPSANVNYNAANTIEVTVSTSENGEESLAAATTAWAGYGIPQAPRNVTMTLDDETRTVTISWEAPEKGSEAGAQGGTVDVVNYFVWRMVNGVRVGDIHNGMPLPDTQTQITYTLQESELSANLSQLSFAVEAWPSPLGFPLAELASQPAVTDGIYVGVGKSVPFVADIANNYYGIVEDDFTIIDANADGYTWKFIAPSSQLSGAVACPNYSTTVSEDDWFLLPALTLQAGRAYHFRSLMHGASATSPWVQKVEVRAGTGKNAAGMAISILDTLTVTDYQTVEADFTVPADGNYFIGIHAVSDADQWETALLDISVTEQNGPMADSEAPAEGLIAVEPEWGITTSTTPSGQTLVFGKATVKVTLPTLKQSGQPLTADDLMQVSVLASDGDEMLPLQHFEGRKAGDVIEFTATDLPSGQTTFTVQTQLGSGDDVHLGREFSATAYVGWDDSVGLPTGAVIRQTASQLFVDIPQTEHPAGAHGAYLPEIEYWAYNGDKASTILRVLAGGYTGIFNDIAPDAVSDNGQILVPDFNPTEGGQYSWHWFLVAVSTDCNGQLIFSDLCEISSVVGAPLTAPVIETGEQTYILSASLDRQLQESWNYYFNRGTSVVGIQPIDDQFGHDAGKSWNAYSAFNGTMYAEFGKVEVASLSSPVFDMDLILEDPEIAMQVVLNGPDAQKATFDLSVMDGVQHISLPLDAYKSWQWVQPTLVFSYRMEREGTVFHDVFFDNVTIFDVVPQNLAVIGFEAPALMKSGQEAMANVTIMNMGSEPVSNYTVTLTEDDVDVQTFTADKPLKPRDIRVVQFRYRANTVTAYDAVGQEEAEKMLVATVHADADAQQDDNMGEAVVTITVDGGRQNTSPTQARAAQAEGSATVDVSWVFDSDEASQLVTETFEDMPLWSTGGVRAGAPEGQLGHWRLYDADNMPTYTWENFEYINHAAGEPQAFQVFTGDVFNSLYYTFDMNAVSGSQYLVSMDPADGNYAPKPDDYLISPLVRGGSNVEFYYGSLVDRPQTVEVLYSETGQDISDFRLLSELQTVSDGEWYLATVKLPETARYFAIRHTLGSYLGYGVKIDDVRFSMISDADHFNVYVDGQLAGTSETTSFTLSQVLQPGVHRIAVTAVFADGTESVPAYCTLNYQGAGISDLVGDGQPFDVFTPDGRLVRRATRSTDGLKGLHIIRGRSVLLR